MKIAIAKLLIVVTTLILSSCFVASRQNNHRTRPDSHNSGRQNNENSAIPAPENREKNYFLTPVDPEINGIKVILIKSR